MPCKVTNQVCCRGYSFILGGAGESTKIGSKKVRLVINDLNTLTAYQVYNEFNQKLNCKRYVVDISAKQFVKYFNSNKKFRPTVILEDETFKPYFVGKITCASLNAQKKLVFVIDSNGFCMKSKFKDSMPTGTLNSIRMQIDPLIPYLTKDELRHKDLIS